MDEIFYKPVDYTGDTGHRCISMEALFREFGVKFEVVWKSRDFDQVILRREPAPSMMDDYNIIYTALYDEDDPKHNFCSYLIDNINTILFNFERAYTEEPPEICTDILNTINDMFNDSLE